MTWHASPGSLILCFALILFGVTFALISEQAAKTWWQSEAKRWEQCLRALEALIHASPPWRHLFRVHGEGCMKAGYLTLGARIMLQGFRCAEWCRPTGV
jgi:hypothetical protein